MSSSFRSSSYSKEEDKHLCQVYLHVSQNPIIGINQSKDQFWQRISDEYHSDANVVTTSRPIGSLRKRMTLILGACSKFKACIRQVELLNPSGASEKDIVSIL